MMKINIKAINLKLTPNIRNYIEEKIGELEKFIQKIEEKDGSFQRGSPSVEALVEIEKTTQHHKKGNVYRAETQIRLLGKSIRSEAIRDNLYLAIVEVKDELQREFKQYQQKEMVQYKRGARRLKKDLRFSPLARFFRKGRIRDEGN